MSSPETIDLEAQSILDGASGFVGPSFSFKNRLMRVAWNIVYVVLFRTSPRPFHAWRSILLKAFGAKLGTNVHVYGRAKIWAPWNLILEDEASIADDVTCYCIAPITLGKRAIVSQGAHLCTGTHDYTSPNFQLIAAPIRIEEGAWVCTEAFVGPGVTIGKDTVVGARSVVTKNMPDGMVCAGNPARPLKPRYANRTGLTEA